MDYKEYLLNQDAVNLSYIAKKMWPNNKSADTYLSIKLHGNGRPWTDKDNKRAGEALKALGKVLLNL